MRRALVIAAFTASLTAQTFVVDSNNGPGTNYTSIAVAVAAVPSGATLLVRPGGYAGFSIQSKALTVLGGPGVIINQTTPLYIAVDIAYLGPTQPVVIRGLQLATCPGGIVVRSSQGAVLLEDIAHTGTCNIPSSPGPTVSIWQSTQVLVRNCTGYDASSSASDVVFESCSFQGRSAYYMMGNAGSSAPALTVSGGTTQIVDCTLQGGIGDPFVSWLGVNRPGLESSGGSVRVLAPGTIQAGVHPYTSLPPVPAIGGSGVLRIDPAVTLVAPGTPVIDPTLSTQTLPMPAVLGTSASPGGTLSAAAPGPIGSTVILVVGLPGAPVTIAGFADPFWVEPAAYAFVAVGTPQAGQPVAASVPVPNNPGLLGVRLAWQSAALTANGAMASNPTLTLVR